MSIIAFRFNRDMQCSSGCTVFSFLFSIVIITHTTFFSGCSSHSSGFQFVEQDITIAVHIASNANNSNAVALDILMPLTPETEAAVAPLTARQWFSRKAQFQRDYTSGQDYWVLHYEYVPGTKVPSIEVSLKDQTKSIIFFADYQTEGAHRFRTTRGENLILTLGKSDFTVVEPNSNSAGAENE